MNEDRYTIKSATNSRNYRIGDVIATNLTLDEAKDWLLKNEAERIPEEVYIIDANGEDARDDMGYGYGVAICGATLDLLDEDGEYDEGMSIFVDDITRREAMEREALPYSAERHRLEGMGYDVAQEAVAAAQKAFRERYGMDIDNGEMVTIDGKTYTVDLSPSSNNESNPQEAEISCLRWSCLNPSPEIAAEEVEDLNDLAEYINQASEYPADVEEIATRLGATLRGENEPREVICYLDGERLTLNDGKAVVEDAED